MVNLRILAISEPMWHRDIDKQWIREGVLPVRSSLRVHHILGGQPNITKILCVQRDLEHCNSDSHFMFKLDSSNFIMQLWWCILNDSLHSLLITHRNTVKHVTALNLNSWRPEKIITTTAISCWGWRNLRNQNNDAPKKTSTRIFPAQIKSSHNLLTVIKRHRENSLHNPTLINREGDVRLSYRQLEQEVKWWRLVLSTFHSWLCFK